MTYFAVSHLSYGQTHGEPGRVQQRSWGSSPETIPRRSVRERDRVAFAFFAIAPSIEHNENNGSASRHQKRLSGAMRKWARSLNVHPQMSASRTALLVSLGVSIAALLGADAVILSRRAHYAEETARLRASMSDVERQRTDEIVAQEENKLRLAIALARHQAQIERALHLSITIDSGTMQLEREGALLRAMPIEIAPEQTIGVLPDTVHLAAPRGLRTIVRVLTASDTWDVPPWVYVARGLPVPAVRRLAGALGTAAVILDGGSVIYSVPNIGPLADSTFVFPGAVRARASDLRAILPNLEPGLRVYFY
jgi:hypothetical protein